MARSRSDSMSSISLPAHTLEIDKVEIEPKGYTSYKEMDVRVSVSEIPKRKPVPAPVIIAEPPSEEVQRQKPALVSGLAMKYGMLDKRKKRIIIGVAALAVLALLALIIGLAVGLTTGKKGASNLPLPTDNGGPYLGDLTYYDPGLGACGITSSDSENICAVSKDLYDAASISANPNENPLCGLKLRLRREGKSVDVTVVDRCVGCKTTDIDVSLSVFENLALTEQGRVLVQWAWIDKASVTIPQK